MIAESILARFESDGLIARQRSAADARRQVIRLTGSGRAVVAGLDARSGEQTRGMLAGLRDDDRRRLLDAMRVITETLTESPQPRGYLLRAPRPGDMVSRSSPPRRPSRSSPPSTSRRRRRTKGRLGLAEGPACS